MNFYAIRLRVELAIGSLQPGPEDAYGDSGSLSYGTTGAALRDDTGIDVVFDDCDVKTCYSTFDFSLSEQGTFWAKDGDLISSDWSRVSWLL